MRCNFCFVFALLLSLSSCSSYMTDQSGFFSKFKRGEYKQAADLLKEKAEQDSKDQILFLLDMGTALFEAGEYNKAIEAFAKAERLTELKDFTSVNEEVVSVITTDKFKKFIPLDYEKIMINVYLALSYFMQGKYEDAMVESRRINNLVYVLKNKGMKSFEESPLAWYISATIYEMQGDYDNARIDYSRVLKIKPDFDQAVYDMYRCARASGNSFFASDLEKKYKILDLQKYYKDLCKDCGQVVIVFSSGEIPIKRQSRHNQMLPEFRTRSYSYGSLDVSFDKKGLAKANVLLDLEAVARKNLDERIGRIMAKRLLGVGTQVAIGYGVAKATDSDALGVIAGLLLHSTTAPDIRSWSTLPKDFQIARFSLKKGKNLIDIKLTGGVITKELNINPRDVIILPLRSI